MAERIQAIHVRYTSAGLWNVEVGDAAEPASQHSSETYAERAARVLCGRWGSGEIVIHDAYHRCRTITGTPRGRRRRGSVGLS